MRTGVWLRWCLVALVAVGPFGRALRNPWLWDDRVLLGGRLAAEKNVTVGEIWREPYWGSEGPRDTFRPLSLSVIAVERKTFGDGPERYHLVSLGLHAAVSLAVWLVLGEVAGGWIGFAGALLFAAHPIHAEAVAMTYGQLELLSALFVLLAVWFYVKARGDGVRTGPFAASVGCAALAAGCKESALMLVALLLLVRAAWMTDSWARFRRGLGWDLLYLIPAAGYLALRYRALGSLAPAADETVTMGYSPGSRVSAVVVSVGHALRLCVWPSGQTVYYGHLRESVFGWPFNEALWILTAVMVMGWVIYRLGKRAALFGAGWFLLALLPVMNIVPSGVLVAERTLYLPSVGICFLVAALLAGVERRVAQAVVAVMVIGGGLAGAWTVGNWCSEEMLWRSTVEAHPRSPMAHVLLGEAMMARWKASRVQPSAEELDQAKDEFAYALELNPELRQAVAGRAAVEAMRGGGR